MNDRWPVTAPRLAHGVTALAAGVALVAMLVAGCATLPTSGAPQHAAVSAPRGGGISPCCGVHVGPPQPGWSPTAVVRNFLLASLISAHNYGVARTYLTTSASASWHPGSEVAILTGTPQVLSLPRLNGPGGGAQVEVPGQKLLATLNSSGQYIQAASGATAPAEVFTLQSENGTYKINSLPFGSGHGSRLLITSALFHLVYAPRNLYYYGLRDDRLLPDPVYVPIQGGNQVETLIGDLRHQPAGSLAGAARTYFPAGAHLAGPPQVFPGPFGGRTAIVNIAVPHGTSGTDVAKMVTQLVCTLTSPVFGPPLFHAIRIKINGRPWAARKPAQNLASYESVIPHWRDGMTVYYLASDGSVRTLGPKPEHESTLPKGPAADQPLLTQVAVSPDGKYLAGLDGAAGTVYTGDLGSPAKPGQRSSAVQLHAWFAGTSVSSMSWDALDDLWVAGQVRDSSGVWVLIHGQGEPQHVLLPRLPGPVTSLRVAPDGVRVAMIIGTSTKAQVWLAAAMREPDGDFRITRPVPLGGQGTTGVLTGVSALTWYDEDHLLVVAGSPNATQLWDVPTDGDTPALLLKEAGMKSVTAAGPGNSFYLGFSNGQLDQSRGLNQFFSDIAAGQEPAYPG
jgi:hypothetical protein